MLSVFVQGHKKKEKCPNKHQFLLHSFFLLVYRTSIGFIFYVSVHEYQKKIIPDGKKILYDIKILIGGRQMDEQSQLKNPSSKPAISMIMEKPHNEIFLLQDILASF